MPEEKKHELENKIKVLEEKESKREKELETKFEIQKKEVTDLKNTLKKIMDSDYMKSLKALEQSFKPTTT